MHGPVTQRQAVAADALGTREWARITIYPEFDQLEHLHASFERHVYAPHSHDTYAFGVIERGVELFTCAGTSFAFGPGQVTIINPDQLHDGRPGTEGYVYRMLYPSRRLMARIYEDVTERSGESPHFHRQVLDDSALAAQCAALHRALDLCGEPIACESAMVTTLSNLILRHADGRPRPAPVGREARAARRIGERLVEQLDQDLSLDSLAAEIGMSRFRLIRIFHRETGMTPHVFRMSRRVARAKALMAAGLAPAETAVACGFHDQPHLTRVFRAFTGITPGAFRRACAG